MKSGNKNEDPESNPWTTLSTTESYDNPWITVTHCEVLNPAGNPGIYGKVHFKNTAIGIVPLDDELNTWIVGQYRYTLQAYSWEIPEGGGPIGTSSLESAQRELREETGITAGVWTEVQRLHLSNSVSDEIAVCYVATDLEFFDATPEETEQLQVKKIPFKEALEWVMTGRITDALAVASILRVNYMLENGQLQVS